MLEASAGQVIFNRSLRINVSRQQILERARTALSTGDAREAARHSAALLKADPRDFEACHLSGRSKAVLGNWVEAAVDFRRALALRPQFVPAIADLGLAQALAGDFPAAYPLLQKARAVDSRPAELHFGIGLCLAGLGDLAGAAGAYREAIARNPRLADAHNNLGVVHDRLGELPQATDHFRQALTIRPQFVAAMLNLADASMRLGQPGAAAAALHDAAVLRPSEATIHADLGAARLAAGDFDGAAQALERALALDACMADAEANLGEALRHMNRLDPAAAAFERAIAINPQCAEAELGLGRTLAAIGGAADAAPRLLRAVRTKPDAVHVILAAATTLEQIGCQSDALRVLNDFTSAHAPDPAVFEAKGRLLLGIGHYEAALGNFNLALSLDQSRPDSLLGRGSALESLGRYPEAIASMERALTFNPGHGEAIASLASCSVRVCDWGRLDADMARLREMPNGIDFLHPFLLLATGLSPEEQSQSLRRRGQLAGEARRPAPAIQRNSDRLKVAYVSPDFRNHPVAVALAGVIDRHDRRRFTPIAVSLTAPATSGIGVRLQSSFDQFIDASSMSDLELADLLREAQVDVAIDLAGHTVGARPGIFAQRISAMQVNYLGFPASSGLRYMDCIIVDDVIVPESHEVYYTERVLRMPHSYLPFDSGRNSPAAASRRDAGLPSNAFVFCAFNNSYKITRGTFDAWLALLRQVPDSVLWMRSMGDCVETNLRTAAIAGGICADRLIFAPYLEDIEAHMARLRLADVFLDSLAYNAHTSASEALWAGVPVITCMGSTFAGRVGASLLTAVGIPELVAADVEGYLKLALELTQSPSALHDLRIRLDESRTTAPLFDTAGYTHDLEQLLADAHRAAAT
jgi:predicted O-linked N-acetylglucosamine transferase (SPINDLY family)